MVDLSRAGLVPGNGKKVVLIGPKASGKTTFKRIFFDAANPLQLLRESVDPTRGVETDTYSAFSRFIAIWDLAGQEMTSWLGDRTDVFTGSSVIVCMLNAAEPLRDSVAFLIQFLKVRAEHAPSTPVVILLTKCDLVSDRESYNMVLKIERYVAEKHPEFMEACHRTKIHRVSITEAYFLKTLKVAYQILASCVEANELRVLPEQMKEIRTRMRILSAVLPGTWKSASEIALEMRLEPEKIVDSLVDLVGLGYLLREKAVFYSLSEKGNHLITACKKQAALVKTKAMVENIGVFFRLMAEMEKIGAVPAY